jgi:uncharacterized protein YdcH (DUF465 family)
MKREKTKINELVNFLDNLSSYLYNQIPTNPPQLVNESSNYIYSIDESDIDNDDEILWDMSECPFFSDEEIDDLKDYFHESGTETYHQYFESTAPTNKDSSSKSDSEEPTKSYSQRVIELQNKMKYSNNPEEIDIIKQNLIDIGWNPEIEYNTETQILARARFIKLMNDVIPKSDIIDIEPIINDIDSSKFVINETSKESIYPVSVVLIDGDYDPFSNIIRAATRSKYTHASIALDGDYTKLYTFSLDNEFRRGGGFRLESIKNYPQDHNVFIYTFFVKEDDYIKLTNRIQDLLYNIKNTTYSIINILLFPFSKIKHVASKSMICSQFVDSLMKMVNVDITKKDSSKVSPAELYKSFNGKIDSRIYKTYDGKVKDLDFKKIYNTLNKLSKTVKPVNESQSSQFGLYITEVKKLPIQIKDNGDILLTNKIIDFDSEYSSSHKLLIEYDKAKNYESMKYELARLYYMNYILEKKLYHNHYLKNKDKNIKTRARVLNDFNKYIKIILKAEPEFNFGEYYEKSQFYPQTLEINKSTIKGFKNLFKYIL